jgi:hypothetical protein
LEGVPEALEIKWVAKDLVDVSESELSIQTDEGAAKGFSDRPYKKEAKKDGGEEEDKLGKGMGHFIGSPAKARRRGGGRKKRQGLYGNEVGFSCVEILGGTEENEGFSPLYLRGFAR